MNDESALDVAKRETARQAVILVFSIMGTIFIILVSKHLRDPDSVRIIKMRSALTLKRVAQRQAEWWENLAEQAATIYNSERN